MKFFAWFWILMGVLWIIWPEMLRGWFTRKTGRRMFWLVCGCLTILMLHIGALAWQVRVRAVKTIALASAVLLFGFLWTVQSNARTQLRVWCQNIPLKVFRTAGAINIAIGVFLMYAKHK